MPVAIVATTVAVGLDPGKERYDGKVGEEDETENNQSEGERFECTENVNVKE